MKAAEVVGRDSFLFLLPLPRPIPVRIRSCIFIGAIYIIMKGVGEKEATPSQTLRVGPSFALLLQPHDIKCNTEMEKCNFAQVYVSTAKKMALVCQAASNPHVRI